LRFYSATPSNASTALAAVPAASVSCPP
jgi:hypothetical protein